MTSSSPRISLLLLQVIFVTFLSMTSSTYLPETGGFSRDDFVEAKRSEGGTSGSLSVEIGLKHRGFLLWIICRPKLNIPLFEKTWLFNFLLINILCFFSARTLNSIHHS
ncbi:hypothetical protein AALP_AA2G164500 [Arabis alpina]|uniref:Uncharacterized protein n=1 Tax=Arabis alpina TaxID=50452 RepID=A0A087HHX0_ARAAL|nr:hypothetical protein AALP_AA2G164500 [Arabis alpina]